MESMKPVQVQPIGYVKNELGRRIYNEWRETDSEIIISEQYQDALYRLDEYSHIEVLFYLPEMNRPFRTRIHPTGNSEYPEMGAFATRTPNRPSKMALTTCRLVSIDGNVLHVKGLDAFNGCARARPGCRQVSPGVIIDRLSTNSLLMSEDRARVSKLCIVQTRKNDFILA